MDDFNNETSSQKASPISIEAVLQQMQSMKAKGKGQKGADIPLATAIVLLEIASVVDKPRLQETRFHSGTVPSQNAERAVAVRRITLDPAILSCDLGDVLGKPRAPNLPLLVAGPEPAVAGVPPTVDISEREATAYDVQSDPALVREVGLDPIRWTSSL